VTSIKRAAQEVVTSLPDDLDWPALCDELYLQIRILQGVDDIRAGRVVPAEVVERKYGIGR
jgi:hypothetical protein